MYALPYLALQWLRQQAINARRRDRTGRFLTWSVVAGVTSALMIVLAAAFVVLLWSVSLWWLALVMAGVLLVPALAGPVIRHVLVPAGAYRLAFHAGQYSRPGPDPLAYALCTAAWATRDGDGDAIAWIEAQRGARKPLGDGEIAATALLAASRGDPATARALMRSIPMIVEDHPAVRELAGEWLACDAAERGAWAELADDAATARFPATPLGYLLEGVAARHTGAAGAPSRLELWARWLIAPRRRATFAVVQAALAARPAAAPSPDPAAATAEDTASGEPGADATLLPAAIAAQLAFETQPATAARLAATVRAWDRALADAATRAWLGRRALELDAPLGAVERAVADVAAAVTDDLARLAEAAELGAPGGAAGPVGHGLVRRLRHGRLDALETGFSRWAERRNQKSHSSIDEWREFVALWTSYNAAVAAGGIELRRLAFPHAFSRGSHMAAWLWNQREEYAVSHAISRWLLAEALIVGDAEAIELGHRNCALSVPTRLGKIDA